MPPKPLAAPSLPTSDQDDDDQPTRSAPPPPPDARILSADQIADELGLQRAEVVDLMRRGELPAKRIGSNLFTTSDKLAAYVARADHRSALPHYRPNDPVVALDEEGTLKPGRFAGDAPDGRVTVVHLGFWGDYEESYPPEQVQPFTARIPQHKTQ